MGKYSPMPIQYVFINNNINKNNNYKIYNLYK